MMSMFGLTKFKSHSHWWCVLTDLIDDRAETVCAAPLATSSPGSFPPSSTSNVDVCHLLCIETWFREVCVTL